MNKGKNISGAGNNKKVLKQESKIQ